MSDPVYLDYNATALIKPEVIEAMANAMAAGGNPSSVHAQGRAARRLLSRAREHVAALVGASPEAIIFTSGGTEANNQALAGSEGPVLASAVEHPSVLAVSGQQVLPVDRDGVVDLQSLHHLLASERPATLAVMLANNETGVIQPIKEIAAIAHEADVRLHVDAIQAAGKIPVDLSDLGADTLSLSAHKFGGPQGVGALVVGAGVEPRALLRGGAQEQRFRAGTENVPGIVGFGEAAALALQDNGFERRVRTLRDRLEGDILAMTPDAKVVAANAPRLPNTTCLVLKGLSHETQLIHFDLAGIAVSAGSACSSGKVAVSPVLSAMHLPADEAACAIRISFGWNSRDDDVDRFIDACRTLLERRAHRESA